MNVLFTQIIMTALLSKDGLGLYVQYFIVAAIVIAALTWLFRKTLFPKRYESGSCGDGDCGCH